jgi:type VI secretion system lysozyme-like protein
MTLFTEIASSAADSGARTTTSMAGAARARASSARDAVAIEIERICGIRRGSLLLAPEYGVEDVTVLFHSFPMIDAWSAHLEHTLSRYEPRLAHVEVSAVQSEATDLTLRAEIRGMLVEGGRSSPAYFHATLDAQCRMSVR